MDINLIYSPYSGPSQIFSSVLEYCEYMRSGECEDRFNFCTGGHRLGCQKANNNKLPLLLR